ncbi:hypothetical protein [Polaribacter porphyrae]|uniref:Glycosyltransferase RgtA/B/C/D-like domain-containing protein n=1 Tax=Polaribacter porphyrae TaxID=1137780 RepID=A0A2S7WKQ1_9FLAO|nr:hypothetical protein [Polaribacter porphyrae]PQJ78153.1 hypothetical protein BTO18_02635 [Polaribacter porphyrae]
MKTIFHNIYKPDKRRKIFFIILGIIIFFLSKDFGFFDDDILFGSKMGNHLYENSIFNWKMPNSFDPGHPPFLATILAVFWKIFGHNLWVSHLAMLPFVIGFFIQLDKFIIYLLKDKKLHFFAFLLVISDPTLATCLILVNIEIITLFFFFLIINSILKTNRKLQFIGLIFLSIISFRSMMLFAGIFIFEILYLKFFHKKTLKKILTSKHIGFYFIASLPAFFYVGWRLLTKGWLQTHSSSPWESLWHFADFDYFIRNCIVLIWRYLDFGRVFIMIFIIISFLIFGKKIMHSKKHKFLLLLGLSSVIFIIVTILIVTNTVGIRYFITSYICLNLLAFLILTNFYKQKKIIFLLLLIGLISGNLWIYPKQISTAWRATLGHIPYHSLRLKAIDYLNKNAIDISNVGSFFPNYTKLDYIDLEGDKRSFAKFNGKNKFVFYANVYNLTDEELNILDKNYTELKQFNNFNTTIVIYILNNK